MMCLSKMEHQLVVVAPFKILIEAIEESQSKRKKRRVQITRQIANIVQTLREVSTKNSPNSATSSLKG